MIHLLEAVFSGILIHILVSCECFNRLIVLVKKGLYATDEGDVSGCEHTMLVFGSFHGFIDHLS